MGIQINGTTDTISAVDGNLDINQNATFGGNVTIGGTLTYEDVNNIDALGIVTSRGGFRATTGGIHVQAGISTFEGDVNIVDKIVHNGDTNTAIRFPTADTISFETSGNQGLRINSDGDIWQGSTTSSTARFAIQGSSSSTSATSADTNGASLILSNTNTTNNNWQGVEFSDRTDSGDFITGMLSQCTDHSQNYGDLTFWTNGSGGRAERLRITSDGTTTASGRLNVQKGVTTAPSILVGANNGGSGMANNSTKHANICAPQYLSDTQTGGFRLLSAYGNDGANYCYLGGNDDNITSTATHPKNATEVRIFTAATATGNGVERFRITSAGAVKIGGNYSSGTNLLHVVDSTGNGDALVKIEAEAGADAELLLDTSNGGGAAGHVVFQMDGTAKGGIDYYNAGTNINCMIFRTGTNAERLRITSAGDLKFNQTQSKINLNTADGSDNKYLSIGGGGDASQSRGAGITLYGNEVSSQEGRLQILAGNSGNANGVIQMHTGGNERLRITSGGLLHVGYDASSSAGTAAVNVVGAGHGILVARLQSGSPTNGQDLGSIGFKGYVSGNHTGAADARIDASADGNHSGSAAGSYMRFWTKPTSTGPGSAPTERLKITSKGSLVTSNTSAAVIGRDYTSGTLTNGQSVSYNGSGTTLSNGNLNMNSVGGNGGAWIGALSVTDGSDGNPSGAYIISAVHGQGFNTYTNLAYNFDSGITVTFNGQWTIANSSGETIYYRINVLMLGNKDTTVNGR